MSTNPTIDELPGLVRSGLEMVEVRLDLSGEMRIYDSIKAQLTYIKNTLDAGEKPAPEMLDRLLLGVYAAREFETADPEFADMLFKVDYLIRRL